MIAVANFRLNKPLIFNTKLVIASGIFMNKKTKLKIANIGIIKDQLNRKAR